MLISEGVEGASATKELGGRCRRGVLIVGSNESCRRWWGLLARAITATTFALTFFLGMAEVELAALSLEHLEDLRLYLQAKQGLGLTTVRNVIDGSLRAMFRDARKAGLAVGLRFGDLEWPRRIVPGPDPFTEEERDRLLKHSLHKRWRLGRHQGHYQANAYFPYYALLFTLFYTGMRPSKQ